MAIVSSLSTNPRIIKSLCICVMIFTMGLSSALAQTTHSRSEWIDKYNALNTGLNNGNGWSSSSDSGTLAWAESYILLSYLNMYEATQDTSYLNSFVSQVNAMLGTMTDPNGDGYNGWNSCAYSVNIVRNGGAEDIDPSEFSNLYFQEDFETPDNSDYTLPNGWLRWQSTPSTAYLDSSNADTGSYGCTIKTNPGGGWQIMEKIISYTPGQPNLVKFRGKISGSGTKGFFAVADVTDNYKTLGSTTFSNADWADQQFVFWGPAASGHTLKIRVYHLDWTVANFATNIDNIKIYQTAGGNLLPDCWVREQSTTAANAYRDYNNAANRTAGLAGFTIITNPGGGAQVLNSPLNNVLVNDNQNYEPGIKYNVSFKAKTSSASVGWQFEVKDITAGDTLLSLTGTNTDWPSSAFSGTFIAPAAAGHDVRIRLYHINENVAGSSNFDEIMVNQYGEYLVHDGMIAMPMAKFIMMVYRGQAPASYKAGADTFLGILENQLFPKWNYCLAQIDSTKSVYVTPDDGTFSPPDCSLPHNQYLSLASAYALLARALDGQKKADYTDRAGKLCNTFMSKLRTVDNNAYEWNYWDNLLPNDNIPGVYVEDTSHGNIDIVSALYCYQAGISITATDMARFANTFIYKAWSPTYSNIGPYINANGNNVTYKYEAWGWIQLGAFDRQIYDNIRNIHDSIWSDTGNMTWRRMVVISEIIKGVLVTNEPFETPDSQDNTLPAGWSRWQSTSSTAYLDSGNAFEGTNGLTIKTNPSGGWQILEKPLTYDPGVTYQVKFMGKISGIPAVGGYVAVYDFTNSATLASVSFTNTDWSQKVFTFTAPSTSGHNVRLRLCTNVYNVSGGIVNYDNVEIREIK